MTKKCFKVIIPDGLKPEPEEFELKTAELLKDSLKSDIKFVKRTSCTTPDIEAVELSQFWEIKNIRGNNKNTIARNLKNVSVQSENVVITLFRTKMSAREAKTRIQKKLKNATRIKRVILITKRGKIIVIKF